MPLMLRSTEVVGLSSLRSLLSIRFARSESNPLSALLRRARGFEREDFDNPDVRSCFFSADLASATAPNRPTGLRPPPSSPVASTAPPRLLPPEPLWIPYPWCDGESAPG
jgi:hypothetical protein